MKSTWQCILICLISYTNFIWIKLWFVKEFKQRKSTVTYPFLHCPEFKTWFNFSKMFAWMLKSLIVTHFIFLEYYVLFYTLQKYILSWLDSKKRKQRKSNLYQIKHIILIIKKNMRGILDLKETIFFSFLLEFCVKELK